MRNRIIALIICLVLAFHTTQVKAGDPWRNENHNDFFGFAPSVMLFPYGENLVHSVGLKLNIPIIPIRKMFLHLDLGWYSGRLKNNDITFPYIDYEEAERGKSIQTLYDDGIINKIRNCSYVPVSLNYDVFFRFANDDILFHFGPSIGETTLIASDEYILVKGNYYNPDELVKLPKRYNSKAVFNYGANIGLKYNIFGSKYQIATRYHFMYNHKTSFENEPIKGVMHQISFIFIFWK